MLQKRIGIMGGTFNPVHIGHLILAEKAREQFCLDEIWFMPLKNPPHKEKNQMVSDIERVEMLKRAIQSNEAFHLSDLELKRDGITYTIDTLKELKYNREDCQFYFILGADSLMQIETWKKSEEIMKLVHLLVGGRNHTREMDLENHITYLREKHHAKIEILEFSEVPFASNEIRKLRRHKKSIRYFVPESVYDYILEKNLYQREGDM